jgi:uncharacterized protein YdgA (DUF945 family)
MERSMKKIVGLVVVLAAIILGSYYGMGVITERTLKKNLAIVNQSNGLVVRVTQYERHWFTSNAILDWNLHIPARNVKDANGQITAIPAKDYEIRMPLSISHGPVIFADSTVKFGLGYAKTDLDLPKEYTEELDKQYTADSVKPRINTSIFVNYLNNCRLLVNVPPFKLVTKQGNSEFEWLGMLSDISISSKMSHVDGSVTVDGVNLTKEDMKAALGKTTSDYDLHRTEMGLFLGDANLSFPSFLITKKDQKIFEIEQFDVHSNSDVSQGLFSSDFKSMLDKVYANGKVYGPGVVELSIKNLDAQILAKINEQITNIQQGSDNQRQQTLLNLIPELPKLVSKGAELVIPKLSMVMPEGPINGNLSIVFPHENIPNPFQLMQKIQGEGKLQIAAPVFKNFLQDSIKRRLLAQLSQPAPTATAPTEQPAPAAGTDSTEQPASAAATAPTAQPAPQPTTVNAQDIEQQSAAQAEERIASLIQSGTLTMAGTDYVISIKLSQGQLTVNNQPFNPAMIQF